MEKLYALLLSLAFSGTVFASSTLSLDVSNGGTINHSNGTVEISLSPLYENLPYKVTCTVTNNNAPANAVVMGIAYPPLAAVKTIFAMNNKQFVHTVNLTSVTNTFIGFNVENVSPANNVITLVNLDDTNDIDVTDCSAQPAIGFAAAK